jgi:hypothetical protein
MGLQFNLNLDDADTVIVKRNEDSFSLLKPVTPNISYRFNTPDFNKEIKPRVDTIVYIKLHDQDVCENEAINNEYANNMEDSICNKHFNKYPIAKSFLNEALSQQIHTLIRWMGRNGFDDTNPEDAIKAILLMRLILTDFYANCIMPSPKSSLTERTPFVEYVIPIFKYYSAVYNDMSFQW